MYKGKFVFSQLLDFLNRNDFNYLARKYDGDKYVKQFTCWNQLCVLMFRQLSNRERLRDLVLAIQAHTSKAYHLGFAKSTTKSNFSKANTNRDYHIFEEFAYQVSLKQENAEQLRYSNLEGMILKHKSLLSFISLLLKCMAATQWMSFHTKKVRSISLTEATTTSNDYITSNVSKHPLS